MRSCIIIPILFVLASGVYGQYVIPKHATYANAQLAGMGKHELRMRRNGIFARYGRAFKAKDLKEFFEAQDWYTIDPHYTDSKVPPLERNLAHRMAFWEKTHGVIWHGTVELDGNDHTVETPYLMAMDDCIQKKECGTREESTALLFLETDMIPVTIYWNLSRRRFEGQTSSDQSKGFWARSLIPHFLDIKVVDLNTSDPYKELLVAQYFDDYEYPHIDSIVISLIDGKVRANTLVSAHSYFSGKLTFSGDGKVTTIKSFCPTSTYFYEFDNGTLIKTGEDTKPPPPYGCPACFTGDTLVSVSMDHQVPIKDLKQGDSVLTYDLSTGAHSQTIIVGLRQVSHSDLIEYQFDHRTITATADHPFYVEGKGWSSLQPERTRSLYRHYDEVNRIEVGYRFLLFDGTTVVLRGYDVRQGTQDTYTITRLRTGNIFFANGVLVGTEEVVASGY